jgi:hypothetical protein
MSSTTLDIIIYSLYHQTWFFTQHDEGKKMNPNVCSVTCDVCGEEGLGNSRTLAAEWLSNERVCHADPRVCSYFLQRKRIALEKRERELRNLQVLVRLFWHIETF